MKRSSRAWVVVGLVTLAPVVVSAQADGPLARVSVGASEISWQPVGASYGYSLRVTGPGEFVHEAQFQSGSSPWFSLFDATGGAQPADGLYKWELRAVIAVPGSMRAAMQRARENGETLERDSLGLPPAESLMQAGSFRVHNGSVVTDERPEVRSPEASGSLRAPLPAPGADPTRESTRIPLTNADGVIRNSLCVGFDCPDAPIFDDSTALLMENNTRIKFGDTSNAPFPNNDWEIEANSSLSGGASYLGFNDCGTADNDGGCATDLVFAVESGARQSALYVESDGDIGIGTSNPVLDIHLVTGNTPAMRLDQDGSSGFAPQVWDVAGNEANFFIRDVSGGSLLPFRIRPGAPTSSIDIATTGNVGIGTAAPSAALHVVRNPSVGGPALLLHLQNKGAPQFDFDNTATGENWRMINTGASGSSTFIITNLTHAGAELTIEQDGDLLVQGTISSGGTVLNVPDYVFERDYELLPIEELASFVAENKHLPNVPSAREIKEGGLNHSEFQMSLLEKVEELTLYTLQQHERLAAQQQEIEELKASLATLRQAKSSN